MENPDQRAGAVSSLVKILRKITRIVQVAPFAYLLLLGICLLFESILPDWLFRLSVNLLNTPVYMIVGMLFLGRWLKLCSWFRTACLLPFTTKVESYIDSFVFSFTQNEVVIINTAIGILFFAFLFLTFRHFFHGRAEA